MSWASRRGRRRPSLAACASSVARHSSRISVAILILYTGLFTSAIGAGGGWKGIVSRRREGVTTDQVGLGFGLCKFYDWSRFILKVQFFDIEFIGSVTSLWLLQTRVGLKIISKKGGMEVTLLCSYRTTCLYVSQSFVFLPKERGIKRNCCCRHFWNLKQKKIATKNETFPLFYRAEINDLRFSWRLTWRGSSDDLKTIEITL